MIAKEHSGIGRGPSSLPTSEDARRLHADAFFIDGLMLWGSLDNPESMREAADGGLNAGIITVAHYPHDRHQARDRITRYKKIVRENSDALCFASSVEAMLAAREKGLCAVAFGFQDVAPIGNDLDMIWEFAEAGVKVIQLTYNDQNLVGSGCCERVQGPLTRFGLKVLSELERAKVAVDISHCANPTRDSAIANAAAPILATHANADAICNSPRNLRDDQIKGIASTGGLIGICLASSFLKRDPRTNEIKPTTFDDVAIHMEHVAELVGPQHLGIGSDVCSTWLASDETPAESSLRFWRETNPEVFGVGRTDRYDPYPDNIRRHADLIGITNALLRRGWKHSDIRGVLGENYLRVLRQVWGH
ncbi:dipeptidase [Trinickia sp. EG282A]|uniref:dipeptidase n=1 Tax=Trinickia sp. EG282A TaxID=3237013 RepID=UPI0034D27708